AIEALQTDLLTKDRMAQIGMLANGFAHQFANIMNVIVSSSRILARRDLSPERVLKARESIDKAANFGKDLIDGISFSAKQNTEKKYLPLGRLVQISEWLVKGKLGERTHVVNEIPDNYQVFVTQTQLINIFMNLFGNSADAGAANIWVRVVDQVTVEIIDDGPGIPTDIQEKIFELHFTTKGENYGSGVGLSLALREAHEIEANIILDSNNTSGARFILQFKELT
ncbi:MAG: HAMP domain-containing sensor histidine kinase, partial [Zetaproteobacteria bacterium]|nr:HAMP domain-containing sensor histidine kinase [Zetaproteobacteria bacterium]